MPSELKTACRHVDVALGARSYSIEIGHGLLARFVAYAGFPASLSHVVVIADGNVEATYGRTVGEAIAGTGAEVDLIAVEPGEASKSIDMAAQLWQKLLDLGADRKTAVVAVGGGVLGDLAGFAAATFARGLAFYQVPTTLLAQVDSSVGGKVGINLPGAKNIIGAFWQPRGVVIDVEALASLPEREYRSGLAEVVKYGVILDADFFERLEGRIGELNSRQAATLVEVVERCCRLKAGVVEADEREESGRRAVLNYGHTFAHALESVAGYGTLLHGEAVSIGMHAAAKLAASLGRIDDALVQRQRRLLAALGLPVHVGGYDRQALLRAMQHDKKTEHGRLRFVLPARLGSVELVGDISAQAVLAAMADEEGAV